MAERHHVARLAWWRCPTSDIFPIAHWHCYTKKAANGRHSKCYAFTTPCAEPWLSAALQPCSHIVIDVFTHSSGTPFAGALSDHRSRIRWHRLAYVVVHGAELRRARHRGSVAVALLAQAACAAPQIIDQCKARQLRSRDIGRIVVHVQPMSLFAYTRTRRRTAIVMLGRRGCWRCWSALPTRARPVRPDLVACQRRARRPMAGHDHDAGASTSSGTGSRADESRPPAGARSSLREGFTTVVKAASPPDGPHGRSRPAVVWRSLVVRGFAPANLP